VAHAHQDEEEDEGDDPELLVTKKVYVQIRSTVEARRHARCKRRLLGTVRYGVCREV
jgi:hypothetical protein